MKKLTTSEINDTEFGVTTIAIEELPIYGEGKTREEAIDDLLDTVIEFCEIYEEERITYERHYSKDKQDIMTELILCNGDKERIRQLIGL
jgi:hypothetical protein